MAPVSAISRVRLRLALLSALTLFALGLHRAGAASGSNALKLGKEDVVAFLGGEDVVEMQRNGYLELMLSRHFRDALPKFRYLAWEGDTVYEQRRDLNFGTWSNQLQRVGATVVIAQFGQQESLKGKAALPQFIAAYEALLDQCAAPGRRFLLISPTSFEKSTGSLPDLTPHNEDLKAYVEAIRNLAARRHCQFGNAFIPPDDWSKIFGPDLQQTRDGLHLNNFGQWSSALMVQDALSLDVSSGIIHRIDDLASLRKALNEESQKLNVRREPFGMNPESGALEPAAERIRQLVIKKNQLWFNYWRPMNWAFLNGDRTTQPSSRDHRDPTIRWFPVEMEQFLPLIEKQEAEIARSLKELP